MLAAHIMRYFKSVNCFRINLYVAPDLYQTSWYLVTKHHLHDNENTVTYYE